MLQSWAALDSSASEALAPKGAISKRPSAKRQLQSSEFRMLCAASMACHNAVCAASRLLLDRRRQILALQLSTQPRREHRLLPGPNHRSVIGAAVELFLDGRRGVYRIGDHHSHGSQQTRRKRPHQRRHPGIQRRRGWPTKQQFEPEVRMNHGNGAVVGRQRQRREGDRGIIDRVQRRAVGDLQGGCVICNVAPSRRIRHAHAEQGRPI